MKKELVSIIIPVYNGEKYIAKCIESILNQSYKKIEIIIINDGSTDKTKEVVENFNDKRIKLTNIENNGVSNARNTGIKLAEGEYITFIDADDYIIKNHVETLINLIKKYNVDIIRFNAYEQKDNNTKKIEFNQPNYSIIDSKDTKGVEDILNAFLRPSKSLRGYSWLLFMKNENIIDFCTDLKYLEDKLFCMENMINNKKTLFINECLYYYINNTTSKTKKIDNFVENINDLMKSKDYIDKLCLKNNYKNIEYIKQSYLSLVLYRLDYLCSKVSYKEFKIIIKKITLLSSLKDILILDSRYLNKFKKIQHFFIKTKSYLIYYMLTKIKNKY